MDWRLGPAYGLAASLARASDSPRVCLVGTALGDAGDTLLAIYAAFGRAGWRVSHLALFPEPNVADVQEHLLQVSGDGDFRDRISQFSVFDP